jgi:TRAP-type uncharacterized transport system substrate-binding protein
MEMAIGLSQTRTGDRPYRDVSIAVGVVAGGHFNPAISFAAGSPDIAMAVGRGEVDVAAINPSACLTMAYRGTGPFPEALPVRALATMPSWDRMAFAVAEKTGLTSIADIRERKYPLHLSVRGNEAHATRPLIDFVLQANGLSLRDIESWGGQMHYVSTPQDAARLSGIEDGSLDAVFDEGIKSWGPRALRMGMRFLPLDAKTVQAVRDLGWPVGPLPAARVPGLTADLADAVSFSGWPIFTHANLADEAAYQMCQALDEARGDIAWDAEGPVALADLCLNTDAAPRAVPLHPGAERYYREHGCAV